MKFIQLCSTLPDEALSDNQLLGILLHQQIYFKLDFWQILKSELSPSGTTESESILKIESLFWNIFSRYIFEYIFWNTCFGRYLAKSLTTNFSGGGMESRRKWSEHNHKCLLPLVRIILVLILILILILWTSLANMFLVAWTSLANMFCQHHE